jgi:ankyrin repeat protein|eukprot:Tamp_16441.p3 GENE.Tamp_16441~~Tamp_16441.p3  ORF type:complete len:146 (-),score=40.14 Tamp_16441:917-1354(-)
MRAPGTYAQTPRMRGPRLMAAVRLRVQEPIDVNEQSLQGHTPLHMCAANGHVEVMQFILNQKGCDANVQTKLGNTAVHLAALNARAEACKLLINNGVDLKKKNMSGHTAADLCPEEAGDLKTYLREQTNAEKPEDDDDLSEFGEV